MQKAIYDYPYTINIIIYFRYANNNALFFGGFTEVTENEEMKKLLPEYGCDIVEISRLEKDGGAVSASRVRKFLKDGNFEEIKKIVPEATFSILEISTLPLCSNKSLTMQARPIGFLLPLAAMQSPKI